MYLYWHHFLPFLARLRRVSRHPQISQQLTQLSQNLIFATHYWQLLHLCTSELPTTIIPTWQSFVKEFIYFWLRKINSSGKSNKYSSCTEVNKPGITNIQQMALYYLFAISPSRLKNRMQKSQLLWKASKEMQTAVKQKCNCFYYN